jgi:hypothetical protein
MKRFLMLVGVAVVAGAMYVAAAPGSQRASGPTAKQFKALKKQVASLSKSEKTLKKEADSAAGFIATCLVSSNAGIVPVNRFGTATTGPGFLYGTSVSNAPRTALDLDPTTTNFQGAYLLAVDPTCVSSSGLAHYGSGQLLLRRLHMR